MTERGRPPPGLARRLAVMCYDGLLLFAVLFAATAVILPLTGGEAVAPNDPLYSGYLLAVSFAYFGWFWTHGGQTLGMRAWGVRVVDGSGRPPGWRRGLLRFVAALLSWLPLGLGFLWVIVDGRKRAWHDRLSGTRLVCERTAAGRRRNRASDAPHQTERDEEKQKRGQHGADHRAEAVDQADIS